MEFLVCTGCPEGEGGGRGGSPQRSQQERLDPFDPETLKKIFGKLCIGQVRAFQGNPKLIGQVGGFPPIPVATNTPAIVPQQFGVSKKQLMPHLGQISGTVIAPSGIASFSGVTDVIGGDLRSPR
jgi:hypothetical protein